MASLSEIRLVPSSNIWGGLFSFIVRPKWIGGNVKRAENQTVGGRRHHVLAFPGKSAHLLVLPPGNLLPLSHKTDHLPIERMRNISRRRWGFWEWRSSFSCRLVRSHHKQPQVILCGGTCPDNRPFFVAFWNISNSPAFADISVWNASIIA